MDRFSLSGLEDIAFDLGVDYENFPHETKPDFSKSLIKHFERQDKLSCLLIELLRHGYNNEIERILSEQTSACSITKKVQIILAVSFVKHKEEITSFLAQKLDISPNEVIIIAAALGSVKLLIDLPENAAAKLVEIDVSNIGKYKVASINRFEN